MTRGLNYDNACKYLAEQYPAEFIRWLLSVEPQDIQVLKTELTRQFLREDMMRESVIYQDIWQRSRQQEVLSLVMRLLNLRFGEVDSSLIERVRVLSVEQLEALVEALFNVSEVADLVAWLEQQ